MTARKEVIAGSPEAVRLVDEAESLVEEYRVLSDERLAATGEALPPFPTAVDE